MFFENKRGGVAKRQTQQFKRLSLCGFKSRPRYYVMELSGSCVDLQFIVSLGTGMTFSNFSGSAALEIIK